MYLETGLGQVFKQRPQPKQRPKVPPKRPPKAPPADRFLSVYADWDLKVPFRKDFKAFRQKVAEAIGRHVAANEKKKIDGLLNQNFELKQLKGNHDYYSDKSESDFVTVRVSLRFRKNNHTDFDWLSIDVPPLSG